MRRLVTLGAGLLLVLGACAGTTPADSDDGGAPSEENDSGAPAASGNVANPQPPGQGYASVDGIEYTFDTPGGLDCRVAADDFGFSYIIGDNEVVLGGGASISGGQWFGTMTLQVFKNNGVTNYSAQVVDNPDGIAIDGNSVSYSGPMEKTETTDEGRLSDPIDVGNGVFSSTCG